MKINLGTIKETEKIAGPSKRISVVISPNPKREREMFDIDGNIIDFKTKQIIRKAEDNK